MAGAVAAEGAKAQGQGGIQGAAQKKTPRLGHLLGELFDAIEDLLD